MLKLLTTISLLAILSGLAAAQTHNHGVFEKTFTSHKTYADPFNEVDVDVIFSKGSENWRVPAFWRGGNQWTVRFAPPSSGSYTYRLESTDKNNPDLNSHQAQVSLTANPRGMLRVAANKRYFEYADGTPFYWLGDTWWTGLSDRLSWDGFQKLTANRKTKGFTVVQIVAGLVPSNEEEAPVDPGFRNEGGAVWDPDFKQINPKYFDSADRRIQLLVDAGIAPAIVGAWHQALGQMGIAKMEKHWRYIIARYAAYPVFWIVGGEVFDPPEEIGKKFPGIVLYGKLTDLRSPGWTEVTRYVRATDPYHHPVTVHEISPPFDVALQDESLTDFDLFQPSHMGWPSIALEVALLDICSFAAPGKAGSRRGNRIRGNWWNQPRRFPACRLLASDVEWSRRLHLWRESGVRSLQCGQTFPAHQVHPAHLGRRHGSSRRVPDQPGSRLASETIMVAI